MKKITMEDLRRIDQDMYTDECGLEELDLMLDHIRDLTIVINDENNICLTMGITRVKVHHMSTVDACREERSKLLADLGTKYLLGNCDDDVREYINDRLKEIDEKSFD